MSTTIWISRARPPARLTSPDAVHGLNDASDLFIRELSERPEAHRIRRDDERHDRIRVGVHFRDDRRQEFRRHIPDGARHLLADVVGRVVQIAFEHEPHGDLPAAFGDTCLDLVDAGDAADRLLHRLDDRRGHFVRARTWQQQHDAHGCRIRLREEVDAEAAERECSQHHERHHQHRGEDRATNTKGRQHGGYS